MNRKIFFNDVRANLFRGRLTEPQVQNIEIIIDTWERLMLSPPHHWIANSLAQIHHETGERMTPVRETFAENDKQAKERLERAWSRGQMKWVRTPYWRDGWFGRGHIQLTHRRNYEKMAERTGQPLLENPSLMLDPKISAEVAVIGMAEGLFTGKKLSDYQFPEALELPPALNPRRIINGPDGTDAKVADYHRKYYNALRLAAEKTA